MNITTRLKCILSISCDLFYKTSPTTLVIIQQSFRALSTIYSFRYHTPSDPIHNSAQFNSHKYNLLATEVQLNKLNFFFYVIRKRNLKCWNELKVKINVLSASGLNVEDIKLWALTAFDSWTWSCEFFRYVWCHEPRASIVVLSN